MPAILIVDDEPSIRNLLQSIFLRAGYAVRVAAGPQEAMDACASEQFDVLLSDIVMPDMNGHELARWFAVHHPNTRTVLMSGFDPGCERCAYSPRCKLIAKPFTAEQVLALVEQTVTVIA